MYIDALIGLIEFQAFGIRAIMVCLFISNWVVIFILMEQSKEVLGANMS